MKMQIIEGEPEFERGELISHEELIKKAQKW
jgi:predicted transcriptional regulator